MPVARYFVGVDVGTGSARAALVSGSGAMVRTCVRPIQTWNPLPDHYEQSSADIWRAVCECVKFVTAEHDVRTIAGIGFDATCSLVVIGAADEPLSVSTTGQPLCNIMLWMDHRATAETDRINATGHRLLRHIGGRTSPEAQCPKMCWLKAHMPRVWQEAKHFFDLPDYLTYRATGCNARSLCSAVAKFNYDALEGGWCAEFFEQIGLTELVAEGYARIGTDVLSPGTSIGGGLSERAAAELGLVAGTPVGASLVDAYAGGLGLFGCRADGTADGVEDGYKSRMALICGTSTGHMSIHNEPVWAHGAWGPFKGVLFPEQFVHSAGQSISGILVDFIIKSHPAYAAMRENANDEHSHAYLNKLLVTLAERKGLADYHELTKDVHVWPDYHGNRSPLADPSMRGMVCGLSMSSDEENLAIMYLAFVQSLAYGTRHIVESMERDGRPPFKSLIICGGLGKNPLFVQTYADACSMPVLEPAETEMVLLGAAILGAMAAQAYPSLQEASKAIAGTAKIILPRSQSAAYHQRKYAVFLKMLQDQRSYKQLMSE